MLLVGYEPTMPAGKRQQTYVLDRAATGTDTARFSIQQFYILPTQYIYVFCVDLRTNSDNFPIQH